MKQAHVMKSNIRAFLFLSVALGKEEEIAKKLLTYDEVKEVHIVPGEWDLLVVLEIRRNMLVSDSEAVTKLVTEKIMAIDGIKDTNTIIGTSSRTKFSDST